MLDRDYAVARRAIDASTAKELSYTGEGSTPRSFFEGSIALAQGDIAGAQKYFQDAQPVFENAVKEAPLSAIRHANLGWLYAFMGRKEDAIREGRLDASIGVVISDRADAAGLRRARDAGIEAIHLNPGAYPDRDAYDHALADLLRARAVDLVCLAGYMRLVRAPVGWRRRARGYRAQ